MSTTSSKKRKERTVKVKKSKPISDLDSVITASDDKGMATKDDSEKE